MTTPNILIQLDTDSHPSVFDRVVAVDAGVDHLFAYGQVTPRNVQGLVHGAIFTRSPDDLKHTAIFIGGSSVEKGEELLKAVTETFFGPLRVSVLLDANGANTTAAAAVLAAGRHVDLSQATALVLGNGPVGQRAARMLAGEGAKVRLTSRQRVRAAASAEAINEKLGRNCVEPAELDGPDHLPKLLDGVQVIINAAAAGVMLMKQSDWLMAKALKVAVDLNAVPPAGIEGIGVTDKAKVRDGVIVYGAIGVGGRKMKIHRAAIAQLFQSNDRILDADAVYELGKAMG
ncbi:MAG: bifunctional NADP-dependent methylenetetrahydromethanopterin dehydrogenase/methylenetetrahydrofolate dehydrogenase [Phycisphaeraceae bacterium]|nr:bifunctional NADP-dependent methylenetetrahydromethanopterin dehydrogenase/methylenetetrahydrofolate dehydrogenase [Phycisphaeraceae bacterium]